ncbi:hypothetical protein SDC9_171846 [bioreactor metagenome]|uniref:Uncharacterized protein n=1 Tax=bioreactor metagenome TaxID=1076179 RepID=A0A645GC07_9ZZZZ
MEYTAEDGSRPAVDVKNGRIFFAWLIINRLNYPALNLKAVPVGKGKRLGGRNFPALRRLVKVGNLHTAKI